MDDPLDPETLMNAYAHGIFPMADDDGRIMWFCPHARAVLRPERFHTSKTLQQTYRQGRYELTVNRGFETVMRHCADRSEGTWISDEIVQAYTKLHELGCAHSIEAWRKGELAGGLYGVAVGGVFCGESMFHRQRDASKVALIYLIERMVERGFCLLDLQFMTQHLKRFGAELIPRDQYLQQLRDALKLRCRFAD